MNHYHQRSIQIGSLKQELDKAALLITDLFIFITEISNKINYIDILQAYYKK